MKLQQSRWLLSLFFIFFFVLLSGCDKHKQSMIPTMPPPKVSVIKINTYPVSKSYEYVGRTVAVDTVDLRNRIEGILIQRNFKEGAAVKKGQVLFNIDPRPYKIALSKAIANFDSAQATLIKTKKDLARTQDLFAKNHVSQANLDAQVSNESIAQAALEASKTSVENAKLELSYTQITAPFSGKIGEASYSAGALVTLSSQALATLTSIDPINVTFQVNEKSLLNYLLENKKATQSVNQRFVFSLKLPNGQLYNEKGTFNFADTMVDSTTSTIALRASFPNPQGLLVPGLYVNLIAQTKAKKMLPLIPQTAVQENQSGHFVIVLDVHNIPSIRYVDMGERIGPMWAVNKGLKKGDIVIINGVQDIRIPQPVNPVMVQIDHKTGAQLPMTIVEKSKG